MDLPASRRIEAVVIGGGPAGAAAARLLAQWGHAVLLLTRRPPRHTLAESIPPSCRKLLAEIGALTAVEQAGFYPARGNTVWWGRSGTRSEAFQAGVTGFQVERDAFDRLLLDLAAAADATVRRDATVREVELPGEEATPPRVMYDAPTGRRHISTPWVLDCSGRAGVIARRGFRLDGRGPTTLAVYAVWERPGGWGLPDETHTLVESYQDGWAWSIPVSPTVRYVAVMVDPGLSTLARGRRLEGIYRNELAKTTRLGDLMAGARPLRAAKGLGASPYSARTFAGSGILLVGDAGSFIDPLSSFGIKKALASAWLAAVVVHTCLTKPAMRAASLAFFDARERQTYDASMRVAARFFGEAAENHDHPFWRERAAADDRAAELDEPNIDELRNDPAVLAAFDEVKRRPAIALRLTEQTRVASLPAVRGNEIGLEPHLVCPWMPSGIRFLRGVDLVRLAALAPRHAQVPDLFDAYNGAGAPAPLPDFLGALSVLIAKRILI